MTKFNDVVYAEEEERTILNASLTHSIIALLIDESSSMFGIQEAADVAIDVFLRALRSSADVSGVIDLAISKYNDSYISVQSFREVANSLDTYHISPGGCTRADIAIPAMLKAVQDYKHNVLKPQKVGYTRAFIFHLTDGESQGNLAEAAEMVHELEDSKSIEFHTIAVPGACLEQIQLYTRDERIHNLANQSERLDYLLPLLFAAIATKSASAAAARSGSRAIAATVNDAATRKAEAILSAFGLEEK